MTAKDDEMSAKEDTLAAKRPKRRVPRIKQSVVIALGIAVALGLWMASGAMDADAKRAPEPDKTAANAPVMSVAVETRQARQITREIVVQGQTEPDRMVNLRAETDGQIATIVAARGQRVKKGDVIARLKIDDRQARLKEAEAELLQRKAVYDSWAKLSKRGHQAQNKVAEARASLETARAKLERINIEIANTVIRSPIDGILETRKIEVGDYVKVGDEIGRIVDNEPIVVTGQVPQQSVARLKLGGSVDVRFVTGAKAKGLIRYIASLGDDQTRTFRIEAEVPNGQGKYQAGISAELRIVVAKVDAHFVSPAVLSLDDAGRLGVKTVTDAGIVKHYTIQVVRAQTGGVWVTGLPAKTRIITRGQGFVRTGDTVKAVEQKPTAGAVGSTAAR